MKKWIALLLMLAVCLSLTACASEDEKAFEAANALLEAGDYEGALDAFYSIELYGKTVEKIYEIEEHLRKESMEFLAGTWMDKMGAITVVIDHEGKYQATDSWGNSWDGDAWYDVDNRLFVLEETTVEEIDGVMHLKGENYDLIPEANFADLGVRDVEITMENWEQYFELRDANRIDTNDFGEVESVALGCGVFLKEEYQQKLGNDYDAVNVSFKIQYTSDWRYVEGDYKNGDYTLGEKYPYGWEDGKVQEEVREVYKMEYEGIEGSDFYGKYAADFTLGYVNSWEDEVYANMPADPSVIAVTGSICMLP